MDEGATIGGTVLIPPLNRYRPAESGDNRRAVELGKTCAESRVKPAERSQHEDDQHTDRAREQAEALAQKLATGTWTHDYPISAEEARELGLPISTEIPDRVLELMALYPQPVHTQQGGVEYLPFPRQKEPTPLPL